MDLIESLLPHLYLHLNDQRDNLERWVCNHLLNIYPPSIRFPLKEWKNGRNYSNYTISG
jgi:hypothetical protein